MKEITTARLWRGQTIRTRADVMRTERLHERSRLLRWSLTAGWWTGWLAVMTVWACLYIPVLGGALTVIALAWLALGPWGLLAVVVVEALVARLWSRTSPASSESRVTSRAPAIRPPHPLPLVLGRRLCRDRRQGDRRLAPRHRPPAALGVSR